MDETAAILAASVAICWLVFQLFPANRSDNGSPERVRLSRKDNGSRGKTLNKRYGAVSILPGNDCCDPVEALGNIRYLLPDAPLLPLSNCDRSRCNCRYRHHYDRRRGLNNRRRTASPVGQEIDQDRRFSRGRRATDYQLA